MTSIWTYKAAITAKNTVNKLNLLKKVRREELWPSIIKQYHNAGLEASNSLWNDSVILLRNIANDGKRESMILAWVIELHESRDGTQRVVSVTYKNVSMNKDGQWVGKVLFLFRNVLPSSHQKCQRALFRHHKRLRPLCFQWWVKKRLSWLLLSWFHFACCKALK